MKAVVLLPTYNERENIILLLAKIWKITRQIKNHQFFFLVIDDNSPDGTQNLVKDYAKSHRNVRVLAGAKVGLGKALLRGMAYATRVLRAQLIIQMDADLSHDPTALPRFLNAIDNGADFVVGSRYISGGSIPESWALHRKIFSIFGNAIVRFGLGYTHIHDWTGGYRAYRSKFYEEFKDEVSMYKGYVFQIAFLHQSVTHGARVSEVPIHFSDRRFGHSKIAPSQYIRDVIFYVAKERFKRLMGDQFTKFCIVGAIGFIINTFFLEFFVAVHFHPVAASVLGAELAIVSNFLLNNSWTFHPHRITGSRLMRKFIEFNGTSVGAIVIQAGSIAIGIHVFGIFVYRFFYMLGVLLGIAWNYFMYSKIIWKTTTT